MAVHRRGYRPYTGPRSSDGGRFLVIPRYALMDLVQMRTLLIFFSACFLPFLVESTLVYLSHNPAARALLAMGGGDILPEGWVNARFFLRCAAIQASLAFVVASWVGPGLVAPDLANGAIPLYLSRPLTRVEYVAGKFAVLFGLLSLITWVPTLLVFALQASLEKGWLAENVRIGNAILLGSLVWIGLLSLMALAVSATVRRRQTASLALFSLLFAGSAFGQIWGTVLGTPWGRLTNLSYLVELIWYDLFGLVRPAFAEGRRFGQYADLPTWVAWMALGVFGALCLWLLDRRVRAKEIVR